MYLIENVAQNQGLYLSQKRATTTPGVSTASQTQYKELHRYLPPSFSKQEQLEAEQSVHMYTP